MVEMISKKNWRVKFYKGKQKKFLKLCFSELGMSNAEMARVLKVSSRTLIDWGKGKFFMPLSAVLALKKLSKITPDIEKVLEPFWYAIKGANKGGLAVYKKYGRIGGNPAYRKRRWYEWWIQKGKFRKNTILNNPLPFKRPRQSKPLAEFFGIMIGDGGMTKYQLVITLHSLDDLEFAKFVTKLIFKLFRMSPNVTLRKTGNVLDIRISRIGLVKFCNKLGLKIGNKIKQRVDIPSWIKNDLGYSIACIRGLFDTDGSVIIHRYKSKGKTYIYKKIGFTSRSPLLLQSVSNILRRLNIKHGVSTDQVRIEAINDVRKYFKIISSSNPKHLNKYFN